MWQNWLGFSKARVQPHIISISEELCDFTRFTENIIEELDWA